MSVLHRSLGALWCWGKRLWRLCFIGRRTSWQTECSCVKFACLNWAHHAKLRHDNANSLFVQSIERGVSCNACKYGLIVDDADGVERISRRRMQALHRRGLISLKASKRIIGDMYNELLVCTT